MNRGYIYFLKTVFAVMLCFTTSYVAALPTVVTTVVNGTCPANGRITVTATGTSGAVLYSIRSIKDSDTSWATKNQQTSNVFNNLAADTFDIAVYDATGGPYVKYRTVVSSNYATMKIKSFSTPLSPIRGCVDDGGISVIIEKGKPPYTYSLLGGPSTSAPIINSTSVVGTFSQLATGNYHIEITDGCANSISMSQDILVQSENNLSNRDLEVFDWTVLPASKSSGCNLAVEGTTDNIFLVAQNTDTVFFRSTINPINNTMPDNYPMQMRIEYPSGSGNYASDWHFIRPGSGADTIRNYRLTSDPKSNKYRILVRNPCNLNDSVFSSEKTFINPYVSRNGACGPYVERSGAPGYDCGPVTVKLTQTTAPFTTKTYTWDDHSHKFDLDITGLPIATYSVNFTSEDGYSYTGPSNTNITIGGFPSLALSVSTHNYFASRSCDFTTAGIKASGIVDTVLKTYTIESPASVVRPPISGKTNMVLWDDLPYGSYVIRVQYENCGSTTKTVTLTQPFSGFQSSETLSYESGSTCGKFRIRGKGWYLSTNGDTVRGTSNYVARIMTLDNVYVSRSVDSPSNTEFVTPDLNPGSYRVAFINAYNSVFNCSYSDRYITIPANAYTPLSIDVSKTGGLVCANGRGTLHVETLGGSGKPTVYQVKPKDSSDAYYTPYQSSPDFTNFLPGNYHVQAYDSCGYTAGQDIALQSGMVSFKIDTLGSTCEGSTKILKLTVVGNVSNILWTNPNGTEVLGFTDTIRNFSTLDNGKYVVIFNSSGCEWRDSITLTAKPKPEFTLKTDTVACQQVNLRTLPLVSGDTVGLTMTYYNNTYQAVVNPAAVGTGIYHTIGTNTSGCTDTSNVNVTVYPVATPASITTLDMNVCSGANDTLRAKTSSGFNIINPVFRWYANQTSTTILHTDTIYPIGIQTTTITRDTIFYVSVSGDNYCENIPGNRKAVKLTITQMPTVSIQLPNGQKTDTLCHNRTIALKAITTGQIDFYFWLDSNKVNGTQYSPTSNGTDITDVVYDPLFLEAGSITRLYLKVNNTICGYVFDSVNLHILPLPTGAGLDMLAEPLNMQEVCTDTVYELKVKSTDLGSLKNVKLKLDDYKVSGLTVKNASIKYPYTSPTWTPITTSLQSGMSITWVLSDSLAHDDSLQVQVTVAAECGFNGGSDIRFVLDAQTVCSEPVYDTLYTLPFFTKQDTSVIKLNKYNVSSSFSIDTVKNNTSDTVTWRLTAVVNGTRLTDSTNETMFVLIPQYLAAIAGSYTPIKNAPSPSSLMPPVILPNGVKLGIPIQSGLQNGDSIIAEFKFQAVNAPCGQYELSAEVIYADSVDCNATLCIINSTQGGVYPKSTVQRYIFTNFADSGSVVNNLWNGVVKIKAQTEIYTGDTIYIDFYVDEDNSSTLTPSDTLSKTFSQITAGIPAGTTLPLIFDSVRFQPQKQLLAVARGGALCGTVVLPITTIIGIDTVCQNDTTLYTTVPGHAPYKWLVTKPVDAVTGATPVRIPLQGSSSSNYANENVARVVWKKQGNYSIWTQYTLPVPPDSVNKSYFPVRVNQRPVVALTANADTTICGGNRVELSHFFRDTTNLGTLAFYKKEGNGSYTFLSNQTPFYVEPLDTTIYRAAATADTSGCESINTVDFRVNVNKMPLIGSISVVQQPDCGTSIGSIKMTVSQGSGSYEYSLDSGAAYIDLPLSGLINNLEIGTYQIYLRDKIKIGCSASISEPISLNTQNSGLYATAQATMAATCSSADGSIQITVNGGVPVYRYKINNGNYENLPQDGIIGTDFVAGTYNITVIDLNNCTATAGAVQVKAVNGLTMNFAQIAPARCDTNGTLGISFTNGVAPYSYRINGQGWIPTTNAIDTIAISAGVHKIYAKDANGCEISDTIRISNTTNLSMLVTSITNAPCNGSANGSINLNISGSAQPLTYSIDGGSTQLPAVVGVNTISGLSMGVYQILLTDANGCTTMLEGIKIDKEHGFVRAVDNRVYTYVDQSINGYLSFDDYENNHSSLKVVENTLAVHGSITMEENGSFAYTPETGFIGTENIQYTIENRCGYRSTAWLYIIVLDINSSINRAPTAMDDAYSTKSGQSVLNFDVKLNDIDPDGDTLSIPLIVSNPLSGTLSQNADGTFNYTPITGFVGADVFTYQICDPYDSCSIAQVYIAVWADSIYDNQIIALFDAYSVARYDTLKVQNLLEGILNNDIYPVGSTPIITIVDSTNNGALRLNSTDGTFTYIPNLDFSGSDGFVYSLCTNTPAKCDTAWVNIFVAERYCPLPVTLLLRDTLTICQGDSIDLNFAIFPISINIDTVVFYAAGQTQTPLEGGYAKTQGDYYIQASNIYECTTSGSVYLKVTEPLQREYVVGNIPGADFITLKEAADRYNTCGISADSKLIISSDLNELETVEFKGTAPGSETYMLIIVSDGIKRIVKFTNK